VGGFFGAGGSHVAKRIAALNGWPHVDVYEQTAHRLGVHRAMPGTRTEYPDWSDAEEAVIEQALHQTPFAVVGLTDGYLPPDRLIDLIQRCSDLVIVRVDWMTLQERLLDEVESMPERLPEFMDHAIPDLHTLKILHGERNGFYDTAGLTVDAQGLAPAMVAHRVTESILARD
jgi:shikimate kinase